MSVGDVYFGGWAITLAVCLVNAVVDRECRSWTFVHLALIASALWPCVVFMGLGDIAEKLLNLVADVVVPPRRER